MAAQSLSSLLTFFCGSSASVKRNLASLKPAHNVKGDQLLFIHVGGTSGGVFGERNAPCLSQHRPSKNEKE